MHNLVSNVPGLADRTDANLVNAWGLTSLATSPWWVSDNGANVATLDPANGTANALVVQVPNAPTGAVSNAGTGFRVSNGTASGPALFIFATEEGKILGWNAGVPPPAPSHQAQVAVDHSGIGAVYKGLAIASTSAGDRLYATDFHNDRVDVFDSNWNPVVNPGAFDDPAHSRADTRRSGSRTSAGRSSSPTRSKTPSHTTTSPGRGTASSTCSTRAASCSDGSPSTGSSTRRGASRWLRRTSGGSAAICSSATSVTGTSTRIALQPNGNFEHRGELRGADGNVISIDGLWSLQFGKGAPNNGPTDSLFFTAGPNGEADGLFGTIRAG